MPPHRMHMTALEITHSRTPEEVTELVSTMRPSMGALTSFTYAHRARLVKPMLSYDLAAVAVSFLPAAGEPLTSPPQAPMDSGVGTEPRVDADAYTYHHLRRDVFDLANSTGVQVGSRYVVPSAHITLARYLTQGDHATAAMREKWIRTIQDINSWLEAEVWDRAKGEGDFIGEWMVGQEKGLDAHQGTLWYGGGRTIMMGEGF